MKITLTALALSVLLLLGGCAERREDAPAGDAAGTPEQSQPGESGADGVDEAPSGVEAYRPNTFGREVAALLSEFDEQMTAAGLPAPGSQPDQVIESEAPGRGVFRVRSFPIAQGVVLSFNETLDDGMAFGVMVQGDAAAMDDEARDVFERYFLAILHTFSDNPDDVLDQLDLVSTDNNFGMVIEGDVSFNYMAAYDTLRFSVDAN